MQRSSHSPVTATAWARVGDQRPKPRIAPRSTIRQEHEYLYPPLTFLRKTGEPIFFKFEETQYEVIDVAPSYPS